MQDLCGIATFTYIKDLKTSSTTEYYLWTYKHFSPTFGGKYLRTFDQQANS